MKLGLGLMRLPRLENGSIDIELVKIMVDMLMAAVAPISTRLSSMRDPRRQPARRW